MRASSLGVRHVKIACKICPDLYVTSVTSFTFVINVTSRLPLLAVLTLLWEVTVGYGRW